MGKSTICPECSGRGCWRQEIRHHDNGVSVAHTTLETIRCPTCGATGNVSEYVRTLKSELSKLRAENSRLKRRLASQKNKILPP